MENKIQWLLHPRFNSLQHISHWIVFQSSWFRHHRVVYYLMLPQLNDLRAISLKTENFLSRCNLQVILHFAMQTTWTTICSLPSEQTIHANWTGFPYVLKMHNRFGSPLATHEKSVHPLQSEYELDSKCWNNFASAAARAVILDQHTIVFAEAHAGISWFADSGSTIPFRVSVWIGDRMA